jgi:hypothetical protein
LLVFAANAIRVAKSLLMIVFDSLSFFSIISIGRANPYGKSNRRKQL